MSQLHSLLQSLNKNEIALIKSKRLIGKEKELFGFICSYANSALPDTEIVLKKVNLSNSHYYKIHSILLKKCYDWLVPTNTLDLLLFLKRKNLFNLLRHEILAQEKHLKKNISESEIFYLKCFHLFIDFPYKYYDKELTDSFGAKYLKNKKVATETDKLYVKYHKLFSDVNRIAAKKNPIKALGISINDLYTEEKKLEKTTHHLAKYYLYRSICSYYTYYEKNNSKVIEYLKKGIALKKHIAYFFPINIVQFLELLYADALFTNNNISEASEIYHSTFSSGVSEDMYGYHYHYEQFCLILIIENKFDSALSILNTTFQPCIDNKMDIYATRGAMTYAKLFISNNDLKNALTYLNIAKIINEKAFYLPFDIQLRVIENIYFFMKKDYEFAHQLATKNIKFLRSQEQGKIFDDYILLWKFIQSLINCIFKKVAMDKVLEDEFEYLHLRYINLYCNLISKIYYQTKIALKINSKP